MSLIYPVIVQATNRLTEHTQTNALHSAPSHNCLSFPPCQLRFSVRLVPTMAGKEKATLLKGLFVSVCFSRFAFIFIFYDCPLLPLTPTPPTPRDSHGVWEIGEGGVLEKDRSVHVCVCVCVGRGAPLKENEKN